MIALAPSLSIHPPLYSSMQANDQPFLISLLDIFQSGLCGCWVVLSFDLKAPTAMLTGFPNKAHNTVNNAVYVNPQLPLEGQLERKPELVMVCDIFYDDEEICIGRIKNAFWILVFPEGVSIIIQHLTR